MELQLPPAVIPYATLRFTAYRCAVAIHACALWQRVFSIA